MWECGQVSRGGGGDTACILCCQLSKLAHPHNVNLCSKRDAGSCQTGIRVSCPQQLSSKHHKHVTPTSLWAFTIAWMTLTDEMSHCSASQLCHVGWTSQQSSQGWVCCRRKHTADWIIFNLVMVWGWDSAQGGSGQTSCHAHLLLYQKALPSPCDLPCGQGGQGPFEECCWGKGWLLPCSRRWPAGMRGPLLVGGLTGRKPSADCANQCS